jgi:hypothetical protein
LKRTKKNQKRNEFNKLWVLPLIVLILLVSLVGLKTLITGEAVNTPTSATITRGYLVIYDDYDGGTTNFSALNSTQLESATSVQVENDEYGKIVFDGTINVSASSDINQNVNLNNFMNISFNRIELISENLTSLNTSSTLTIYGLTFDDPEALIDGEICLNCTEVSYTNGNFTFTAPHFTIYGARETTNESEEEEEPAPSAGTTGGGGGGGGGSTSIIDVEVKGVEKEFELDRDVIKIQTEVGTSKKGIIWVTNTGTETVNVTLSMVGVEGLIELDIYNLELGPGERKPIEFTADIPEDYELGVYTVRVLVNGKETTQEIDIILEILPSKKDVEVAIKVLNDPVTVGGTVTSEITIINKLTEEFGDVKLTYGVLDFENNLIVSNEETISLGSHERLIKKLELPSDIEVGKYLFFADVEAESIIGLSSKVFEVITAEERLEITVSSLLVGLLLALIVVMVSLAVYYIRLRKKRI